MASAAALALALAGCGALVQADARRATLARLRTSRAARRTARAMGCALLAAALVLACLPQGPERGVPVFLGLLTAAMAATLLTRALAPGWHARAAGAAGVIGAVLSAGTLA